MTNSSRRNKKNDRKTDQKLLINAGIRVIIIILMAFAVSVILISNYFNRNQYVLGFCVYITLSDSMYPVIQKGSLLIAQRVNADTVQEGDIITYKENSEIMTQRVVRVTDDNGSVSFVTKGDANEGVNALSVPADDLIGRFVYAVNFAGSAMLALRNPEILSLCIACICAFIIFSDTMNKRIKRYARRKKKRKRHCPRNDIHYITGIKKRQSFCLAIVSKVNLSYND